MKLVAVEDCLRTLELRPAASKAAVRATFRRLAKTYHPDLNRTPAAARRFVEVVRAYRVLQAALDLDSGQALRRCPRCGRFAELLDGLDGRPGCVDCLLGETQRRRYLPLPTIEVIRHIGVLALYATSLGLIVYSAATANLASAIGGLTSAAAGLLLLALACLRVRDAY